MRRLGRERGVCKGVALPKRRRPLHKCRRVLERRVNHNLFACTCTRACTGARTHARQRTLSQHGAKRALVRDGHVRPQGLFGADACLGLQQHRNVLPRKRKPLVVQHKLRARSRVRKALEKRSAIDAGVEVYKCRQVRRARFQRRKALKGLEWDAVSAQQERMPWQGKWGRGCK